MERMSGEPVLVLAREPAGDGGVVGGGPGEGAGGELAAQGHARAALRLHRRKHLVEILSAGADRDIGVVLGRRAGHGGAADIDIFDAVVEAGARLHRPFEGVEGAVEEINAGDAVGLRRLGMVRRLANVKQAAVHHRVQGLDPAVHHLGKAGEFGDFGDREAGRLIAACVPPVEISSTPRSTSARAASTRPVLS